MGKCWRILMAIVECAGIDGRMKTIIPRPVVNSPHCPAGFSFFVFICVHLFSFIVSLYGFDSGCSDSILISSVMEIENWF